MKKIFLNINIVLLCDFIFLLNPIYAQLAFNYSENFNGKFPNFTKIGRGICEMRNGIFCTKEAYATFGQEDWRNYSIAFKCRTPESEDHVEIWAGFRAVDRYNRYVLGFRGGLKNDIFLARMGYMGTDEFLCRKELDFSPQLGKWYNFLIEICGNRIRIFVGNKNVPLIDIIDRNSNKVQKGKIILGGGWLNAEYDDLEVTSLSDDYFKNVVTKEVDNKKIVEEKKEIQRQKERATYDPITVLLLNKGRTEISLNGKWLFMPTYQLGDEKKAISPSINDMDWHVMNVPNFWNPIRIWLHGETFDGHPKGVSDIYYQNETRRCENYTFDYQRTEIAWYRQWIRLPKEIKDKRFELTFDAVSKVAEVWINGHKAGSHIGMFGDFKIDGTGLFKAGKNLIVVKVMRNYIKNIENADSVIDVAVTVPVTNKMLKDLPHGFYGDDPAGIWQPVKLVITEPLKINDVFIKPALNSASFDITVKNYSSENKKFAILIHIINQKTKKNLYKGELLTGLKLGQGEERIFSSSLNNLKPELWSPGNPNLYNFEFIILERNKEEDKKVICSGFRTFEAKNGFLYLNGHQFWLRGANQTPFALAPNDKKLANVFFQLMKAGNMICTRTHTSPYNELWMDAADQNGIGISFEGTWPWLMIQSSMPDKELINLWAEEFLALVKKYRNHPSLLLWTVNNEMKFYDNDPDINRAKLKMEIISDVVKRMRKIDPTRPICFDSNYRRQEKKFGKEFYSQIDDGDIDDIHYYPNWYNSTLFKDFRGEFQKANKNEGRVLISQEMSTGYPNNETGHATRFYTMVHQNPSSLIGDLAYEYSNPSYFLKIHSFITGEMAEALRRSNEGASGILHFSLITWFKNVYNSNSIKPYPVYYAMKRALQPVLVSAELWGRHFYSGEKLPVRICIVNDNMDYKDLMPSELKWQLVDQEGKSFASGEVNVGIIEYYNRKWVEPVIKIPESLPKEKLIGKLKLSLNVNGKEVSYNEYELLFAQKEWSKIKSISNKKIELVDFKNISSRFDFLNIKYNSMQTVKEALKQKADIYIFSGLDPELNCSGKELNQIRTMINMGNKVLLLNCEKALQKIYPEYIKGWILPTEGDIVNMEIPESPIFDEIDPLELRYFNNNLCEVPTVCHAALKIEKNDHIIPLASHMKIHGYINGNMEQRQQYVESIMGFPIIMINNGGVALISTMDNEKASTDPIMGKLLTNMVSTMLSK